MRTRWFIAFLVALALAAAIWFIVQGANRPADPYFLAPIEGFDQRAFSIEGRGEQGTGAEHCALLATTSEQLSRGLMGRRDLGGYDGMVFQFPDERVRPFTMRGTLIPLSIAWFDDAGNLVDRAEMTPCPDRLSCPSHTADRPFRYALEVARGGLDGLGVGAGAHLTLGQSCS